MSPIGFAVFALMGIVFHEMFVRMRVAADVRRVFHVAPDALRVIRSDTLTDLEKESAVRRMSLVVLGDTLRFTFKLVLVLAACVAVAALGQWLFSPSAEGLGGLLASWQGLIAAVVAVPLWARLRRG